MSSELVCTVHIDVAVELGIVGGSKAIAKVKGQLRQFRFVVTPYIRPEQNFQMVMLRKPKLEVTKTVGES